MAPLSAVVATLLLILALILVGQSACYLLKGSVACTDCMPNHDLSGVRVAVQCRNQKKRMTTLTNENGYFELDVPPTNTPVASVAASSLSPDCFAVLLGGPEQLCAFKRNMASKIVKVRSSGLYGLSTSLTFITTSCPSATVEHPKLEEMARNGKSGGVGPSDTYGPFISGPPGSAMPPFYFLRFLPIIGIP